MIDNFQPIGHDGAALPAGSAFTQILDQKTLEECQRGIGRPLFTHEVKILDDMLVMLRKQNQKKWKKGNIVHMKSVDELVSLFIERINSKHMRDFADRIAAGQVQAHG